VPDASNPAQKVSFRQRGGQCWTTDQNGMILGLLAAEMTAITGRDPGPDYDEITARHGVSYCQRIDSPLSAERKAAFKKLTAEKNTSPPLAGAKILAALTRAPGNNADIGGLKIVRENGWFAAGPRETTDSAAPTK
jgi:phosphoglucomutase